MQEIIRDLSLTFLMGGTICVLAQLLIDLTRLTPARILVLLVSSGVLLYGVGVYEPLYGVFGAGVSVPLLGFGANIAKGVREAVDTDGVIGILTGGLTASAGGITAALILGLLASLVFRPRPKRM
jgi:stage V sporulation protein AE